MEQKNKNASQPSRDHKNRKPNKPRADKPKEQFTIGDIMEEKLRALTGKDKDAMKDIGNSVSRVKAEAAQKRAQEAQERAAQKQPDGK